MQEGKFAETADAAGRGAGSPTRTNSKKEKNEGEVADEAAKVSEYWKRRDIFVFRIFDCLGWTGSNARRKVPSNWCYAVQQHGQGSHVHWRCRQRSSKPAWFSWNSPFARRSRSHSMASKSRSVCFLSHRSRGLSQIRKGLWDCCCSRRDLVNSRKYLHSEREIEKKETLWQVLQTLFPLFWKDSLIHPFCHHVFLLSLFSLF